MVLRNLLALANKLDLLGLYEEANVIDLLLKESKAKHRPPKKWFNKMKKKIKKQNKDYSLETLNEIVGNIWYNRLSDKKRQQIYNRHGKSKSPNK